MTTPTNSPAAAVAASGTAVIDTGDGRSFEAYVSRPAQPNGRGIVVLQEIFGVTHAIREVADRYAAEGYLAMAPDLFWRLQPGIELSHSKEDIARAFELLEEFNDASAVQDIGRVVQRLRDELDADAPVAVLGMCLGGKLAYLSATRLPVDAAISFYGVGIEKHLDEADALSCPFILHFGARDNYIDAQARDAIETRIAGRRDVQMHVYEEAGHGFYTREQSTSRGVAHARTTAFLDEHLSAAISSPGRSHTNGAAKVEANPDEMQPGVAP